MRDQTSRDAGTAPSSGSVAEPEKAIESPTFHVSVGSGAVIFGTGGEFETLITVDTASKAPFESETRRPTV